MLKTRIAAVTYPVTADDGEGGSTEVDLSLQGQLLVTAEYFDDSAPNTVLATQRFQVSASESEADIAERIIQYGARARDARVRVAELAAYVGVTLDIP